MALTTMTVSVVDRFTVRVVFNEAASAYSIDSLLRWTLSPVADPALHASCQPINAVAASDRLSAVVVFHPEFTPNVAHVLTYRDIRDSGDVVLTATFTPDISLIPESGEGEFPKWGIIESITDSVGEDFYSLYGRPQAFLIQDATIQQGIPARAVLKFASQPADGDTVTLHDTNTSATFTFKDTPSATGHVDRGSSATEAATNLKTALSSLKTSQNLNFATPLVGTMDSLPTLTVVIDKVGDAGNSTGTTKPSVSDTDKISFVKVSGNAFTTDEPVGFYGGVNTTHTLFTETTLDFPSAGNLYIGGEYYSYTGKFSGGFTGVEPAAKYGTAPSTFKKRTHYTRDVVYLDVHAVPPPSDLTDTSTSYQSFVEEGFRDTQIMKAAYTAFDKLVRAYGLTRPFWCQRKYWRQAVKSLLFAPRGTPYILQEFLEAALGQYADVRTVEIDTTTAGGTRILPVDGVAFSNKHVARHVKLKALDHANTPSTNNRLGVDPLLVHTALRDSGSGGLDLTQYGPAGYETTLGVGNTLPYGRYEATFLPFEIQELTGDRYFSGEYTFDTGTTNDSIYTIGDWSNFLLVRIYVFEFGDPAPATYVQEDADEAFLPTTAQGGPTGGYIQSTTAELGNQAIGPHPVYLANLNQIFAPFLTHIIKEKIVAAGVRVELIQKTLVA
mgnify:CR=1 FL=1